MNIEQGHIRNVGAQSNNVCGLFQTEVCDLKSFQSEHFIYLARYRDEDVNLVHITLIKIFVDKPESSKHHPVRNRL